MVPENTSYSAVATRIKNLTNFLGKPSLFSCSFPFSLKNGHSQKNRFGLYVKSSQGCCLPPPNYDECDRRRIHFRGYIVLYSPGSVRGSLVRFPAHPLLAQNAKPWICSSFFISFLKVFYLNNSLVNLTGFPTRSCLKKVSRKGFTFF